VIVAIKICIVLFFIAIGVGHINGANYSLPPHPLPTGGGMDLGGYFPFGWAGTLGGAAFIFFAYIGFDAVSTTAEEAKNPGRDLPFGIIMSLLICTILYIVVVAVLNGVTPYFTLNNAFPVAYAVSHMGLSWGPLASVIISFGAIAGLTTVLLVMMFGQSRIFFAMSRDGLIPPSFTRIHPTWRTPIYSTIFFGICIAAIAAFTPINIVGSLTNMGTLVAFILVSLAVPILRNRHPDLKGSFALPGGPYIIPALSAITAFGLIVFLKVGNPLVFGFFPIVWFWFIVWMIIGLIFYFAYGRKKSTVALQQVEGLAAAQPRVN
jgi:APA family basic amino acid/polyamine antiporter